jgi:hypothetical protein
MKNKKALDNKIVGGDTDISAITITYTVRTSMTHMSFVHHTLMGMQQDVTILNRYGVEHVVEMNEQPVDKPLGKPSNN